MNNRKHNAKNPFQGDRKKVLCVCSAGLLRSPTAAIVLAQEPFEFNTRAAGIDTDFALIPVDDVLLHWADEVVTMTREQMLKIMDMGWDKSVVCLDIPDEFEFMHPTLVKMIIERSGEAFFGNEP